MHIVHPSVLPFRRGRALPNRAGVHAPGRVWPSLALALVLSACAHSPHAAVQEPQALGGTHRPIAPIHTEGVTPCRETPSTRIALQSISQELQTQGLAFKAACHTAAKGWVVQVQVVDGVRATKTVRGPLADGQAVDMGTPAGVGRANAALEARGFSPDVEHNRQWLRALMASHQFVNLPDAWWHFAQRGAGSPGGPEAGGETDLAAR